MKRPPIDPLESNPLSLTTPRIVSLVPSQTELLYDLGLDEEVVGITKFCVHPQEWFRTKTRVGGTKTVDKEKVFLTMPTLILANKEENVKEQVDALQEIAPVYVSDIATLDDALEMIFTVGSLTHKVERAKEIIHHIQTAFDDLQQQVKIDEKPKAAYLIWREPYMAAGGDTFINDLMNRCGFNNLFSETSRYPEVTIQQLAENKCELLLLSSEPFPFKQKHVEEIQQQLPGTKIILVDGEMFSWYGSRLLHAPAYFKSLIKEIELKPLNC